MIESVNFVVLGDQSVAGSLGKKGTSSDITLYDNTESGTIRTWVTPNGYPEKIQPLIQAINISEYAILYVTALDKFAGEQIVALDTLGIKEGILCFSHEVDEGRLAAAIRGTVVENYARADAAGLLEAVRKKPAVPHPGKCAVIADHIFDVKGAGTIVLGKVYSGTVHVHDELYIMPSGIKATVKSIQVHDKPVNEASSPARVGLAIKGAKVQEIGRGDIICEEGAATISDKIELDYTACPYYTGKLESGQNCMVGMGLQMRAARITGLSPFTVSLGKPAALLGSEKLVLVRPESDSVRIMGAGSAA